MEGPVRRYRARMVAAGWVEGGDGIPPANRTVCGACETKRVTTWCGKCGKWYHSKCIPGLDWKNTTVIWCPPCLEEVNQEEMGQMGRCILCSQEVRGGGSAWYVLSGCRHDILTTYRARPMEPFQAAVAEVIGEMEDGDWDQGPVMSAAIMLD